MSHAVEISLLGRRFTIRTDDDPEQVREAASLVQEKIDELREAGAAIASDRLMALVALNLAGELIERRASRVEGLERLISRLDEVVSQAEGLAKAPLR